MLFCFFPPLPSCNYTQPCSLPFLQRPSISGWAYAKMLPGRQRRSHVGGQLLPPITVAPLLLRHAFQRVIEKKLVTQNVQRHHQKNKKRKSSYRYLCIHARYIIIYTSYIYATTGEVLTTTTTTTNIYIYITPGTAACINLRGTLYEAHPVGRPQI